MIPKILNSFRYWSNKIHAAIDANTPSKEKIIAAGAGDKCWSAIIWSKNANPLDSTPAYNSSAASKDKSLKEINSIEAAGIAENIAAIKHWNAAIVIGKLNIFKNFDT